MRCQRGLQVRQQKKRKLYIREKKERRRGYWSEKLRLQRESHLVADWKRIFNDVPVLMPDGGLSLVLVAAIEGYG